MLPRTVHALAVAPLFALLALPAGCSAAATGPGAAHDEGEGRPGEVTATTSEAVTSDDAISRGMQWVDAKLLYCQSANGQPDDDTSCSSVCNRESNPQWDPYRSDCSGFVSWAWGLSAPGLVTSEFAPFDTSVSSTIQAIDLQPGDACNKNAGGHIVLFEKWVTVGQSAVFMEEPGCSANPPYAHEFTSNVTINGVNIDIAYEGETFTAIRFDQMTESPADAGTGAGPDAGTVSGDASKEDGGAPQEDAGSGSSSGSSSSGAGGSGSSGGSSSGGSASGHDAGSSGQDNGAGASNVGLDSGSGGSGCDVGGVPARGGEMAAGLAVLGLALARRRRSRA